MTPELAPLLQTIAPCQQKLFEQDRFKVHSPLLQGGSSVASGLYLRTRLLLVSTRQGSISLSCDYNITSTQMFGKTRAIISRQIWKLDLELVTRCGMDPKMGHH
ncbi:hypothetical protein TNCV_4958261 [Trichonephila clavipes]|nr:hypothetical protein TNCV_4958261 [Trichonephila clavipes]